jgi:hypothetical protein
MLIYYKESCLEIEMYHVSFILFELKITLQLILSFKISQICMCIVQKIMLQFEVNFCTELHTGVSITACYVQQKHHAS